MSIKCLNDHIVRNIIVPNVDKVHSAVEEKYGAVSVLSRSEAEPIYNFIIEDTIKQIQEYLKENSGNKFSKVVHAGAYRGEIGKLVEERLLQEYHVNVILTFEELNQSCNQQSDFFCRLM